MSAPDSALLPQFFPASWASEWGEDRIGLFMVLVYKGVQQVFRWIPPGTFQMGSPENEVDRYEDEIQHAVTLTKGYWLADSACTQALWTAVMGENPSRFQDNQNNPVENVSWDEARQFIERLNSNFPYPDVRLPTEAEWEYACRAGTDTPFSFGHNITPEQVNYNGNYPYAGGIKGLYREKTMPVKSLPANRWGLYEMHGNVFEWSADWYGVYAAEAAVNPVGPVEGSGRVLRGGSWYYDGRSVRSAYRRGSGPDLRYGGIGFRLALGQQGASRQE
jgi:sulfatase modifying factor 1